MDLVNLKPEDVKDTIPAMREMFQKKFSDNISKNVYDKRDVDRLMTDDLYACAFMRQSFVKGNPEKVMDQIDTCFRFRKEMGIWDIKDEDFPHLWDKNAVYYRGHDRANNQILYFEIKAYTPKGEKEVLESKRFIAHNFEKHHRANPSQLVVVIMDMTGAKISNLSIEMSRFIISCLSVYFPGFLAYLLNYDMPFLLNATWQIIAAFLAKEQKERVIMAKKKDIKTYLDEDNLWDHMK